MAFPSATRNIRGVKLSRESLDLLSSMGSNFSDERTRESRWGETKLRVYPGKIEGRKEAVQCGTFSGRSSSIGGIFAKLRDQLREIEGNRGPPLNSISLHRFLFLERNALFAHLSRN